MASFPLIDEKGASPEVRAVFDDIRESRKTDWINNFWRALANHPPTLRRIWQSLKEVMAPGPLGVTAEIGDPISGEDLDAVVIHVDRSVPIASRAGKLETSVVLGTAVRIGRTPDDRPGSPYGGLDGRGHQARRSPASHRSFDRSGSSGPTHRAVPWERLPDA